MTTKEDLIKLLLPLAVLIPLTDTAKEALPVFIENKIISIMKFPFSVGRESRVQFIDGKLEIVERPKLFSFEPNNDLYIIDRGELLNISREHFLIDKQNNGYILTDRCSACGTIVNDLVVGGFDKGGQYPLKDGDIIEIGKKGTPYKYEFRVL